jgi:hypothetical protein
LNWVCIGIAVKASADDEAADRAYQRQRDHNGDKTFTVPELHWFRKNAYNMGVAASTNASWSLGDVVRIFAACLVFCGCYPGDIPQSDVDDIPVTSMRCRFVTASALVSLARTEDTIAESLQRYLETRKNIAAFNDLLECASDQQRTNVADLKIKVSTLFVFDFEAAIALGAWDDLPGIIRRSGSCQGESFLKVMPFSR